LANKVLAPIGINTNSVGFWLDATGTNPMTYCCLDMRPDDFARFGLLFARGGAWDGEQIISPNYVSQSMIANGAYGYQWWVLNSAYWNGRQVPIDIIAALGLNGQKIYIWPEQDIVIVVLTK
jgi:CubicO group peptidase (beta-lactamase class C family)